MSKRQLMLWGVLGAACAALVLGDAHASARPTPAHAEMALVHDG